MARYVIGPHSSLLWHIGISIYGDILHVLVYQKPMSPLCTETPQLDKIDMAQAAQCSYLCSELLLP